MNSKELRQSFLDFFKSKDHKIVPSAPMVVKGDPTLMFTNAGMNQFKERFLGLGSAPANRVTDSQKCLRVSGKHNDLEEVGHDTYHHTMFEMLGNWSFGDYFKKEAIAWAWEYLTEVLKLDKDRLYVSVFEGYEPDGLERDDEAAKYWEQYIDKNRIINGSKKDNFWEMGDQGPCGPCSEIHIDLRPDEEREKIDGKSLVNEDHSLVIEIWNLVFMQFNRKANGTLESLPEQHVDTGMGFERLAMAVQGKTSNYDTDIFQPLIQKIAKLSQLPYGKNEEQDIAMRVISDHLRAVSFSIADGQLPSNNGAGYVIRRILRRAVRYAYTFLNQKDTFIYKLLPTLVDIMGEAYPELVRQQTIIEKVIIEEEKSFLKTLSTGIKLLDQIIEKTKAESYKVVSGKVAFELNDTYGFPLDLTELILKEHNLIVNRREFDEALNEQKERSRKASQTETDDWVIVKEDDVQEFIGYDYIESDIHITKYRKISIKNKTLYQLVFTVTPFYAEGGGQVGDNGYIQSEDEKISIIDVKREHNQIVHITKQLPKNIAGHFKAVVNTNKRIATQCNHTATHLLHHALREVLGTHVEQKGSLVNEEYLRFDFSHFQKMTVEELKEVERLVNEKIRSNIALNEHREIPINKAQEMGAMALFGEKYGDVVRVIQFDDSVELCGGTHVQATGEIGMLKILSESSIAAGIRRIEAITALEAEKYINNQLDLLHSISGLMKSNNNIFEDIKKVVLEKDALSKQVDNFLKEAQKMLKDSLKNDVHEHKGINMIIKQVDVSNANALKDIAFQLKGEIDNLYLVLGAEIEGKAYLAIMISDNLVKNNDLNAGTIIRNIAKEIQGGGGGQAFFATAGGKNPDGIQNALDLAHDFVS